MNIFCKIFAFSLALFSTSLMKAEVFEVILYDDEIKIFFANQGLDLDKTWKEYLTKSDSLFYSSYFGGNDFADLIKKIFKKSNDPVIEIPATTEKFKKLLEKLGFTLYEDNTNRANVEYFNSLLTDEANRFEHTIQELTRNNLLEGISIALSSYCTQKAVSKREGIDGDSTKQTIHLHIKFVVDTQLQTITLQTCPNSSQATFKKTYTKELIAHLVKTKVGDQPTACNNVCNFIKGLTCATAVIVFVVVSAAIIIDPATVEEFIKALEENQ